MKNHRYIAFSPFCPKIKSVKCNFMLFIYKSAKFAPAWTPTLKIWALFAHQTLTEHAL